MMYSVCVKYFPDYAGAGNSMVEAYCFVPGNNYGDVIEKMVDHYGEENIEEIKCKIISPDDFIEFNSKDEKIFSKIESTINEQAIW